MHMPSKRRRVAHTPLIAAGVFLGLAACTGLGPSSPAPFLTDTLPPPVVGYATATRDASVTPAQVAQANTATLTHTPTGSATFTAAAPVLPSAAATIQFAIGQAVVAQEGSGDVNRTATLSEIVAQVVARLSEQEGFGAAIEGQVLGLGGQVQTGAASRVRIDLSDETILRLDQNSFFTVTALEPAGATPFARLFLSIGRIFSVLKGPGTLEIETPVGIASVRGSAMVTWYDPTTEIFTMGCGAGDCTLQPFLADGSTLTFTVPVGELGAIVGAGNAPTSAGPLPLHFVLEWLSLAAEAEPELRPLLTQVASTATAHAATQTAQPTT
ncbi:MAG: FecR domain-containing protein, partial [Anaerolineales bacterium]